ncbi:MAG: nucleoside hydrolase [Acidimicrobiia bacterium]|nr:nucleoside hydrolase [Acidimicrobiia bacterium]MYJ13851.1 nucleoside hydrolase [Acidimicrobiia bacterium]
MAPRKIIIDTDPGQDDALAILLALGSPELEVLGITCVAGNVPLPLTIRNARLVCELAGRADMKIFAGCERPMVRDLVTAEAVHGETGLDGPNWDKPTMPVQEVHAVDWLVETLMAAEDGEITLCPVGPITNVAMAMVREPRIVGKIAEIVTMGGGFFVGGNTTPVAEFNVYVDPHAAAVMYRSGVPITTMPLDVTHKALMSPAWIESVREIGGEVGAKTAAMVSFYERYDLDRYGSRGGPLHDPATIAYLLRPELYGGKDVFVEVETQSELTMGMTVVDYWDRFGRPPNCRWISEVDSDGFFALIRERLMNLPAGN